MARRTIDEVKRPHILVQLIVEPRMNWAVYMKAFPFFRIIRGSPSLVSPQ
jgi:hypothetical protein